MAKKTTDFGKAYRKARNSGKKTFTWKGKSYTTQSKSEKHESTWKENVKHEDNIKESEKKIKATYAKLGIYKGGGKLKNRYSGGGRHQHD
tara:strand:- start:3 stop:272 length:270 start_codon:yes stop_codon:yes gene_type:complete